MSITAKKNTKTTKKTALNRAVKTEKKTVKKKIFVEEFNELAGILKDEIKKGIINIF